MTTLQQSLGRRWLPLAVWLLPLLTGCGTTVQPPYVVIFESYFPSWIACAVAGCIAAVLLRVWLVRKGIDEYLPLHLLTYLSVAAAVMFLLSLTVFAR